MPATLPAPLKVAEIRPASNPIEGRRHSGFGVLRMNVSDAIRLFLRQAVAQNGLPFEVKAPNAVTLAAMEEARSGNLPRFGSVRELFDDLEKDSEE